MLAFWWTRTRRQDHANKVRCRYSCKCVVQWINAKHDRSVGTMMECSYIVMRSRILQCQICGRVTESEYPPEQTHSVCSLSRRLPGTILHDLLCLRLGVGFSTDCGCKEWVAKMNEWGPEGCREYLESIVDKMLASAEKRNWKLNGRPLLSAAACVGCKCSWGKRYARRWARKLVLEAIERSERSLAKETN